MFIHPVLIATVVFIPHICGELLAPLLIDSAVREAIDQSLGVPLSDEEIRSPHPNFTENISFRLYTRMYKNGVVLPTDPASLSRSPIDQSLPTKIFINGFQVLYNDNPAQLLKHAYLGTGDYNFIVVDWYNITRQRHLDYGRARSYSGAIGGVIGRFLDALADSRMCLPQNQHIIGHSLGGQIAGLAARAARTKPGRCTGLDPAGPLFELSSSEGRIDSSVATLVDVLHTAAGTWGISTPVGHIDFYANGGTWPQPDCHDDLTDFTGHCSHLIALNIFANTILHPTVYIGNRCQTSNIIMGLCPKGTESAVMGEHVVFDTPGLYYVGARINRTENENILLRNQNK